MRYSLINIYNVQENGRIDGVWMQDFIGSFEEAVQCARETEAANSYKISIAVVGKLNCSTPTYCMNYGLRRLDI